VRKVLAVALALAAVAAVAPGRASARDCGIPDTTPLWVDYVDAPFWPVFAKAGVVTAISDTILPGKFKDAGVPTMRLDLYLNSRVGQPSAPLDPAKVVEWANKLFAFSVENTGCATPWIVENELFGANLPTPWSDTNQRYRANVLLLLRTLAQRGAHPVLLINSDPFVASPDAAAWWRNVAAVSDIIREDYVPADLAFGRGIVLGNRTLRQTYRRGLPNLLAIGIPPEKLGIMISFSTVKGYGGRNGLQPASAWYRVTKWYALSAKTVAAELHLGSVWSWGWRWWRPEERDPAKAKAACVWLWARDQRLCNGPRAAGKDFVPSLTEGQLRLPAGVHCRIEGKQITTASVFELTRRTGDRNLALAVSLARLVVERTVRVSAASIRDAEQAVIAQRFGGSRSAYQDALSRAHVSVPLARRIIAEELRKARIELGLRPRPVTSAAVRTFYDEYPDVLARAVRVKPAPLWLNGRSRGIALSSLAPPAVFSIPAGRAVSVRGLDGVYRVTALGPASPLASIPRGAVSGGIRAALATQSRGDAFHRWLEEQERVALRTAICLRDELPEAGGADLSALAPFLSLAP
jgi:hypothetical protein